MAVVLHADVSPRESATIGWLQAPESKVSYHVLVHRDGSTTRFVPDDRAAWACGKSKWGGLVGLNRHTLSLAFSNRHDGIEPLTPEQITTAALWCDHWRTVWGVHEVLTHAMISPRRKSDPERIPNFRLEDYR
jgi:N-acetyl-anhydromuramyl-L-alanine amidase AmpD